MTDREIIQEKKFGIFEEAKLFGMIILEVLIHEKTTTGQFHG